MHKGIKIGLITAVVLGFIFVFPVYGLPMCCGEGNEQLCCDSIGKKYCPVDKTCRTECPDVPPDVCEEPLCLNDEGKCCLSCPTLEECLAKDMCRFNVDGCYLCSDCSNCRAPKCVNENDACCTTCPTEEDCSAMKDANGNSYIRVKDSKNKDCYVCEPLCQDTQCEDCHVCDPNTNRCASYCTGDDVCCNEACCDKCITEEECESQEGMYYYISAGCPVCEKKCDESTCGPCEDCSDATNRCEWRLFGRKE